jgi:colicin import membrane protein
MAKKSKKSKKASANPADALRDAVERTFKEAAGAGSGAQKRMQEVFDEFGSALARLRETVDEKRVIETLETLRDEVAGLRKRVADLERSGQSRASAARTSATEAARNVAARATRSAKPKAKAKAKAKPAAKKRAAAKRKPAAKKRAAAKRKPAAKKRAAAKKPAAKAAPSS